MSLGELNGSKLTLDEFIAFNDELRALTRAGVPLERGLLAASRDLPRRLRGVTERLTERMSQGETLSEALQAEDDCFPPIYRAVVEVGIASGRLPAALESLSETAKQTHEVGRTIRAALIYPFVLLAAVGVLVFALPTLDRIEDIYRQEKFDLPTATQAMVSFAVWMVRYWWLVLGVPLALWLASGKTALLRMGWGAWLVGRLPWVGEVLAASRKAAFTELLGLLTEQHVPLPQALRLAGKACGDSSLQRGAEQLAQQVESGQSPAAAKTGSLPPLLQWFITIDRPGEQLGASLRRTAGLYRQRARRNAEWVRFWLPSLLALTVGGSVATLYIFAVMGAAVQLIRELS
ncbi:MAG: type II secretion system F family protein [Planctomycetales bacterium]